MIYELPIIKYNEISICSITSSYVILFLSYIKIIQFIKIEVLFILLNFELSWKLNDNDVACSISFRR